MQNTIKYIWKNTNTHTHILSHNSKLWYAKNDDTHEKERERERSSKSWNWAKAWIWTKGDKWGGSSGTRASYCIIPFKWSVWVYMARKSTTRNKLGSNKCWLLSTSAKQYVSVSYARFKRSDSISWCVLFSSYLHSHHLDYSDCSITLYNVCSMYTYNVYTL